MEEKKNIRTRRVGTLTFGCILVLFGVLFLVHAFVPLVNYGIIFRLWPCIFVFLGMEILISNYRQNKAENEGEKVSFVYDKSAILLTVCLTFFAMIMAAVDFGLQYGNWYMEF